MNEKELTEEARSGFEQVSLLLETLRGVSDLMRELVQRPAVVNNFYSPGNYVYNGAMTFNGPVTFGREEKEKCEEEETPQVPPAVLDKAIVEVQHLLWGQSAYGVIFGVCRDVYHYPDNIKLFEDDLQKLNKKVRLSYACPYGTIAGAMHNNVYLRMHVDRWAVNGAKKRTMHLLLEFKKAVNHFLDSENLRKV